LGEATAPPNKSWLNVGLHFIPPNLQEQGTGLIFQAVASIRAIVEIDQAQCDRQRQQDEADIALGLTYFII